MTCEIDDCDVCEHGWTCDECGDAFKHRDENAAHDEEAMCDACAHIAVEHLRALLEEANIAARVERQRTDAAQAEVARRGDVMLAALREIERGEYNAATVLLSNVVRPPLPSPAQVAHYQPGPAPERRPAEVMHTTIGGRGVVGRLKP